MMRSRALLSSAVLLALVTMLACATTTAHAANWLLLQGTQGQGRPDVEPWGFVQAELQHTSGRPLAAGAWSGQAASFNRVRPRLGASTRVNVIRARPGLRGRLCVLSCSIHYFALGEFGNNGLTRRSRGAEWNPQLTDLSVTFNFIPGARIRVWQFKTPSGEEGLQAIHAFDYVNFSAPTGQLALERIVRSDGSGTPGDGTAGTLDANQPRLAAFRDIGIQVFDAFRLTSGEESGPWELSYAAMVGNANGLTRWDDDRRKDFYLYTSLERITNGKGPRREGLKLYAWFQLGRRKLTREAPGVHDRRRWGGGAVFRRGRWRVAFEYIGADGMIFAGTDGAAVPGERSNSGLGIASVNIHPDEHAWGWVADLGVRAFSFLEFDLRFDQLHRGTRRAVNERRFETVTLGAQLISPKRVGVLRNLRSLLNLELRSAEAPRLDAASPPNRILDRVDPRLSLQVLAIF